MTRPGFSIRTFRRLAACAILPALLGACSADYNPSPTPSGYKNEGQQYNADWTGPVKQMNWPGQAGRGNASSSLQPSNGQMNSPMTPMPGAAPMPASSGPMPIYNNAPHGGNESALTPGAGTPSVLPAAAWEAASTDLMNRIEHDFGRMRDSVFIRPAANPNESGFAQALTDTMRQRGYKLSADAQKSAFSADYTVGMVGPTGQTGVTLKIAGQDGHAIQQESGDYSIGAMGAQASAAVMPPAPAAITGTTTTTTMTTTTASATPPAFWTGGVSRDGSAPTAAPQDMQASAPSSTAMPSTMMPPPMPSMAAQTVPTQTISTTATPGAVTVNDGKTYVYDGHATKPAGKTAYEQMQGVDHEVDRPSDSGSELADR